MSKRVLAVGTIHKGKGGTATQRTTHTVNTGKGYGDSVFTSTRRYPTGALNFTQYCEPQDAPCPRSRGCDYCNA